MKLPRCPVVSLLSVSVLAVLAVPAWWWITWPERTALEFAKIVVARRIEETSHIVPGNSFRDELRLRYEQDAAFTTLEYGSRSMTDCLCGRQEFQLVGTERMRINCGELETIEAGFRFTVERGAVHQPKQIDRDSLLDLGTLHMEAVDRNWAHHRIRIN